MTNICMRWMRDRTDVLHNAWFNGIGVESWENVWGIFNKWSDRDALALKRLQPLYKAFGGGGLGLLNSFGWEPFFATEDPEVYSTRFPTQEHEWGAAMTLWTLIERGGKKHNGSVVVFKVPSGFSGVGCEWYDVYNGTSLSDPPPPYPPPTHPLTPSLPPSQPPSKCTGLLQVVDSPDFPSLCACVCVCVCV